MASVTREALGHHVEVCFNARFREDGARCEVPGAHEFITKATKELQEAWRSPRLWGPRASDLCDMGRTDGPRRYKIEGLPPCPDGTLLGVEGKLGVRM